MKKFFIKICKFFGFEIIDQNEFTSPTLNKELNEDLSILNKKSIVLPLGEVKITRKVQNFDIFPITLLCGYLIQMIFKLRFSYNHK